MGKVILLKIAPANRARLSLSGTITAVSWCPMLLITKIPCPSYNHPKGARAPYKNIENSQNLKSKIYKVFLHLTIVDS